jgi:triosephosphate isomerase
VRPKGKRAVFIAGNWKMNHGPQAAADFMLACKGAWEAKFSPGTRQALAQNELQLILFTPDVSLRAARETAQPLPLRVGAQNVHWEKSGAFTGEISAPMCQELGIACALTGHSERRQYFGETNETVKKRTQALIAAGFTVFLCIGETLAEREAGQTLDVLKTQLSAVFPEGTSSLSEALESSTSRLVIAYEPVWAIGTGKTATPEQAQEAHAQIRAFLANRVGAKASEQATLVYGGSVTPANLKGLLEQKDIDGALVGGASVKPESWLELVEIAGKSISG